MRIECVPVSDQGLTKTADVLARGFSDYFVPIVSTEAVLWGMARVDSVDLAASWLALLDGEPVGAALIARRGWTSRLAGMAIVPTARRHGVGRALVKHVLAEARARGDRQCVLEVIEQNQPAVELYAACGFQKVRRLVGFAARGGEVVGGASNELREVDLRELAAVVATHQPADWPWQLSGETIAQLGAPHVGFTLHGAWVALSMAPGSPVSVRSLVVTGEGDQTARAVAILRAVRGRWPERDWRIGALWPEEHAAWFEQAGLTRQPMTQWQLVQGLRG